MSRNVWDRNRERLSLNLEVIITRRFVKGQSTYLSFLISLSLYKILVLIKLLRRILPTPL